MPDASTQSITINADPGRIMAVIADFDAYPVWAASVKKAEVLEPGPDGRALLVAFTLDAGILQDSYDLSYIWDGDHRVDWTLVRGQMQRAQHGSYVLEAGAGPTADGQPDDGPSGATQVTYSLSVDLAFPMLGLLKRKAEKMVMDTALKELKKRVESTGP